MPTVPPTTTLPRPDWSAPYAPEHSLAACLGAILAGAGAPQPPDRIRAHLGLGAAFTCDPTDLPASAGVAARDLWLPVLAADCGLRIRPLHPPAAARGLGAAREFRQHFFDSYVPLLRRGLECGQVALAWRGVRNRDYEWSIVTGEERGTFVCEVPTPNGRGTERARLDDAALQIHVIEEVDPAAAGQLADLPATTVARRAILIPEQRDATAAAFHADAWSAWLDAAAQFDEPACGVAAERLRHVAATRQSLARLLHAAGAPPHAEQAALQAAACAAAAAESIAATSGPARRRDQESLASADAALRASLAEVAGPAAVIR